MQYECLVNYGPELSSCYVRPCPVAPSWSPDRCCHLGCASVVLEVLRIHLGSSFSELCSSQWHFVCGLRPVRWLRHLRVVVALRAWSSSASTWLFLPVDFLCRMWSPTSLLLQPVALGDASMLLFAVSVWVGVRGSWRAISRSLRRVAAVCMDFVGGSASTHRDMVLADLPLHLKLRVRKWCIIVAGMFQAIVACLRLLLDRMLASAHRLTICPRTTRSVRDRAARRGASLLHWGSLALEV